MLSIIFFAFLCWSGLSLDEKTADVCILGAGPSGMSTATFLKDAGKQPLVIEIADDIGGHCDTVRGIDIGVTLTPDTAAATAAGKGPWTIDTVAFVTRFLGASVINRVDLSKSSPQYYANLDTGVSYGTTSPYPPNPDFFNAFLRYSGIVNGEYNWTDLHNYPDNIPNDALKPFDQWIVERNLTGMVSLLAPWFSKSGYGSFSKYTALSGMINLPATALYFFTVPNTSFTIKGGCGQLYDSISDYIGNDYVKTNSQILLSVRETNRSIHFGFNTETNDFFLYKCKATVVAFPQVASKMSFLGLDSTEFDIFNKVLTRYYYGGSVNLTGPFNSTPFSLNNINFGTESPYFLPDFPAVIDVSKTTTNPNDPGTLLASSDNPIMTDTMKSIVLEQLLKVPNFLVNATLDVFDYHEFAPYPTPSDLNITNNFYTRLTALQGHRSTYYVGALPAAPCTYCVWDHAIKLVTKILLSLN